MFTINGNGIRDSILLNAYEKVATCANTLTFPIRKLKQCIDNLNYQPETITSKNEFVPTKNGSPRALIMLGNTHIDYLSNLISYGIKNYACDGEVENLYKANLEHLPLSLFLFIQSFYDFCEEFDCIQGLMGDNETAIIKSLQQFIYQSFSDGEQENTTADLVTLFKFKAELLTFAMCTNRWSSILSRAKTNNEQANRAIASAINTLNEVKKRIPPLHKSIDATSTYCFEYLPEIPLDEINAIIEDLSEINSQIGLDDNIDDEFKEYFKNSVETLQATFNKSDLHQLELLFKANGFYHKFHELTTKLDNLETIGSSVLPIIERLKDKKPEFYGKYNFLYTQELKIDLKIDQEKIKNVISDLKMTRELYCDSIIDLSNDILSPKKILKNKELTVRHLSKEQLNKVKKIHKSVNALINQTEYDLVPFEMLLILLHRFKEHYGNNNIHQLNLINKAIELTGSLNAKKIALTGSLNEEIDKEYKEMISQLYLTSKTISLKAKESICANETTDEHVLPQLHAELQSICEAFEAIYLKGKEDKILLLDEQLSKGASSSLDQLIFFSDITPLENLSLVNAIESNGELQYKPKLVTSSIKTFTSDEMSDFFEKVIYVFDKTTMILNQFRNECDLDTNILNEQVVENVQRLYKIYSNINDKEIELLEENEKLAIKQRLELFSESLSSIKNEEIKKHLFTLRVSKP